MRTLLTGLVSAALFLGCELDTGEDPISTAGEGGDDAVSGRGGRAGGTGGAGATSAGSGGSSTAGSSTAGTQNASGGTGPAAGSGGNGKGGSGTGGAGQASGGAGPSGGKGGNLGGAGNGSGGSGAGGKGSGGSSGSSAGTSAGGSSGECTQNLGCTLDPPPSTGDRYQDCVDRINQFRTECACMEPLERWTEAEACADQQAEYDSVQDEAHAGFRDDICSPGGSAQNECPGYRSETQVVGLCLQQMWDEGPPPQDPCDGECFQTYGHFINMTNERYTKVACGFYTTEGNEVWAVQNFSR
jgi:hypothetical protein